MKCESCAHDNVEGARFCASCGVVLPVETGEGNWIGRLVGGRFRITQVLGEGGMGVVYAGEQHMGSTVRKVAIKTLHQHLSRDPSILARFHRECGTVAQLEHPNTIKVYDFGATDDGTLYIAMEFVQGSSLDKLMEREGPISPARVVSILKQVCGALDEAHDKGIVHRDLKPENIVLGERLGNPDFVKVLDFGIAARSDAADRAKEQKLTQQGTVLGTPPYMSPEQFTGQELDRRSDIYSLGVMTYEMLTGRLPFRAETAWQWATEHMTAQPFPMEQTAGGSAIPDAMRQVVMRSLSKTPDDRPSAAGEFVRELEASLAKLSGSLGVARTEVMQAAPTGQRTETGPRSLAGAGGAPRGTTDGALSATQGFEIPTQKRGILPLVLGGSLVLGLAGGVFVLLPSKGTSGDAQAGGGAAATALATSPIASPEPLEAPKVEGSGGASELASSASGGSSAALAPSGGARGTNPSAGQSRPAQPTEPVVAPPDPKTGSKGPECSACPDLVSSGRWAQAGLAYAACDATAKSQCSKHARKVAPTEVEQAAGNCQKIRAIVRGLQTMGEKLPDRPKVREAVAKCK